MCSLFLLGPVEYFRELLEAASVKKLIFTAYKR